MSSFYDFVTKIKSPDGSVKWRFPTLCICQVCEQPASFTWNGEKITDTALVHTIAVAQWMHYIAPKFANNPPRLCQCAAEIERADKAWESLQNYIVEDSEWQLDERQSNPSRGWRVYNRQIRFDSELSADQFYLLCQYLRGHCPGRGIVRDYRSAAPVYSFTSSVDSGD